MNKNMWMVRAGESAYLIDNFKKKKYFAIGWDRIKDASKIKDREEVKQLIQEKYSENKKHQNIVSAGQFSRFLFEFKKNFGFEVNLGLLKFIRGASER